MKHQHVWDVPVLTCTSRRWVFHVLANFVATCAVVMHFHLWVHVSKCFWRHMNYWIHVVRDAKHRKASRKPIIECVSEGLVAYAWCFKAIRFCNQETMFTQGEHGHLRQ